MQTSASERGLVSLAVRGPLLSSFCRRQPCACSDTGTARHRPGLQAAKRGDLLFSIPFPLLLTDPPTSPDEANVTLYKVRGARHFALCPTFQAHATTRATCQPDAVGD